MKTSKVIEIRVIMSFSFNLIIIAVQDVKIAVHDVKTVVHDVKIVLEDVKVVLLTCHDDADEQSDLIMTI